MSTKEQRFVEEYTRDFCGTKAAIRAGYSEKTAGKQAYQLKQRPDVIEAIEQRLKALAMDADEAIKRVSDNARTRLNDYLKIEEVWESPMVKRPLADLIIEMELENQIDQVFLERATLSEEQQDKLFARITERGTDILRFQIELEINPTATRFMKGEPVLVKKSGVDLVKLADADEKGALKKLSFNERGLPSVELYSAAEALDTILKIHGKLINKVDNSSTDGTMTPARGVTIDPTTLTPEQLSVVLDILRNGQKGS